MKRDTVNYLAAGGTALAVLGFLAGLLVVITGEGGATERYIARYENVSGVKQGTPVYFEGYRVGHVESIDPETGRDALRFRVALAIDADWPVPEGSVARIASAGLLADAVIGIRKGDGPGTIEPGGALRTSESAGALETVNELAAKISKLTEERVDPLLALLNERLGAILGGLENDVPKVLGKADSLLEELNETGRSVNQLLSEENRERVAASLRDFQAGTENLKTVSADLERTQARLDKLLADFGEAFDTNRRHLRQTLLGMRQTVADMALRIETIGHNLEAASRNVNEFSREVRRNPARLLDSPPADNPEQKP